MKYVGLFSQQTATL